jgi:polyisoprenoid-binding protein YceI
LDDAAGQAETSPSEDRAMSMRLALLAGLMFAQTASAQAVEPNLSDLAGQYVIAVRSSSLAFSVGAVGGNGINARFERFKGNFDIDPQNIGKSHVEIRIFPDSVKSGEGRVDGFLKSDAVFDAANQPEIVFKSTSVRRTGPDTALIEGRLTARGKTFPEKFTATLAGSDKGSVHFTVTGNVLRSRYGMDVGTPIYSNVVKFDMNFVGKRG